MKYIDSVIRIHTDNVTFNKEHDDVLYESKTFKLTKEAKTTGLIVRLLQNFKDDVLDDEEIDN